MCGIIGLITNNNIDKSKIFNISALQNHRGPDEQNIVYENINDFNISLSHQRLSIVDLKTGQQPMYDNDDNIIIVFNGEIYNHNDIRAELQDKGYIFKTNHSDTEVIIYAYKEWGNKCFNKFNGMWAIAIVDKLNNKIILSRDRVGKKPLHYYFHDNELIFASELKTIKNYFNNKLTINDSAILEYLEYGYIHSPKTIYKEVKKIKPTYYLEFDISMINKYVKPVIGVKLPNKQIEVSETYYDSKIKFIPQGNIDLRFDTILKNCGVPNMGTHNAVNDAIMTAIIYLKLTKGK